MKRAFQQKKGRPFLQSIDFQIGKTEPVDHAILPNLTQHILVLLIFEFKEIYLSKNVLDNEYKLLCGLAALSDDIAINLFTL